MKKWLRIEVVMLLTQLVLLGLGFSQQVGAGVQTPVQANPRKPFTGAAGENLIENGDFQQGNKGFTSEIKYTKPAYNCLWEQGFTIAPKWNDPLLHRLFAPGDYSAPIHEHGDEQVYYANIGGDEMLRLWTSSVKCKAHTMYRLRFWSLSLNETPEWIPDFMITANGDRSAKQPSGYRKFRVIEWFWNSGNATKANLEIVRLTKEHTAGLLALANVEMVEMKPQF